MGYFTGYNNNNKVINNRSRNYCTETMYQNDQQNKIKLNGNFMRKIGGKMDKPNTESGFSNDISSLFLKDFF